MRSVEIGHSLISWGGNIDQKRLCAQGIIADIVTNIPQHDERWFSLTMHHLGISEHALRGYLDHGDSILLANLIHLTHQLLRNVTRPTGKRLPWHVIFYHRRRAFMFKIPYLDYNVTSVTCGTRLSYKHVLTSMSFLCISFNRLDLSTSLYIEGTMPFRPPSLLPPTISPFWTSRPRIPYVASLATAWTLRRT